MIPVRYCYQLFLICRSRIVFKSSFNSGARQYARSNRRYRTCRLDRIRFLDNFSRLLLQYAFGRHISTNHGRSKQIQRHWQAIFHSNTINSIRKTVFPITIHFQRKAIFTQLVISNSPDVTPSFHTLHLAL